jgi:hypothetical protein
MDPDLVDIIEIGKFLKNTNSRVNYLLLHDPHFPPVHSHRIDKRTGRKHRLWERKAIEQYKADRILRHSEYRTALRRKGEIIPPSSLPVVLLTKNELREECERLRKLLDDD